MNAFVDIFDSSHYRNVRNKPLLEAETLPPWCYTSQEFYDREVDRIFRKTWNFLGRADEIPNPGDYMTFELCGEPLFILRDKDGSIRGYANTCRHRGAKMLEGKGNCRAISCPYHGWVYALNGSLIGTAGMEKTRIFDRSRYGLAKISVETWDGFVFASLNPKPEPLKKFLGNLPQEMAPYNFKDYVCTRRKEYILDCNWKLFLENAMEEYHTPVVHRQSIGAQSMVDVECTGQWRGLHMEAERTIAVLPEDAQRAFPAPTNLTGRPANGTYFMVIYPQTFFACTQDTMWWLQQFPMGPAKTKVVVGSCFPRATVQRNDFQDKVQYYYKRWDKSLPEDNDISEMQQSGLQSSLSAPGRYSWHEPVVHDIAKWVLDHVLDTPKKKAAAPRKSAAKRASSTKRPAKRRTRR